MILNETIAGGGKLIESLEKLPNRVLCRVQYPICNIGKINANKRIYGRDVWETLMENKSIMASMKERSLFGHAEHPEGTQSKTPEISHVVTKLWVDEGRAYQEYDVLDTPQGRIIDCLLESGCNIRVSTRAEGDLREDVDDDGGKCYHVIAESYKYITTDFTADPSTFGVFPIDIKRNVVSTIRKEVENVEATPGEKKFAVRLLESMVCKDKSKCQKCGCCDAKVNEVEDVKKIGGVGVRDFHNFLKKYDLTKEQVDRLPDEAWNKLDDALFNDDKKLQAEIATMAKNESKKTNEGQVTMVADGADEKVAVTGDVKKIVVDPQINTASPGGPIDVTVLLKDQQVAVVTITKAETTPQPSPADGTLPVNGTQPDKKEEDGDISDEDIELSDEDFEEEYDIDADAMEESKANETKSKLFKDLKSGEEFWFEDKPVNICVKVSNNKFKYLTGDVNNEIDPEREVMTGYYGKVRETKINEEDDLWSKIVDYSEAHKEWEPLITMMAQVWNGGFEQWFGNGYGDEGPVVKHLLRIIGTPAAKDMIDLVIVAMKMGDALKPTRNRYGNLEDSEHYEKASETLDGLDDKFYDGLDDRLVADIGGKFGLVGKMRESYVNETKEIKAMYRKKGLKVPKGKGIHTKAFHKCATNYASKIKSGKMTKKDAYKRCMGGLGKKNAVKKSHQRNESIIHVVDYINELLNEKRGPWGEKINKMLYDKGYNVNDDQIVEIVDKISDNMEDWDKLISLLSGEDAEAVVKFLQEKGLKLNKVEESKINEEKDLIFVDDTGFPNAKFGVYRKSGDNAPYLTFSFQTKEKATELAKTVANMLGATYSETKPEEIAKESKPVNTLAKEITELQIKEAVARAERDVAVESLDVLANKDLEVKILTKKLKESRGGDTDESLALRSKLEEKTKAAKDWMARAKEVSAQIDKLQLELNDAKTEASVIAAELEKQVAKLQKERDADAVKFDRMKKDTLQGEVNTATANEKKTSLIKEYVSKQLNEGFRVSDDNRALLESCQTIDAVDKALDECRDLMRRRALHTKPLDKVILEKQEVPVDPIVNRQRTIINNVLKPRA